MLEYGATAADRGLRVIIAGAGGAAHLPGNARVGHAAAGDRRTGPAVASRRHGLVAVDRADARRRPGRDRVDRRCAQRRACSRSGCSAISDPELRAAMVEFQAGLADTARGKNDALQAELEKPSG